MQMLCFCFSIDRVNCAHNFPRFASGARTTQLPVEQVLVTSTRYRWIPPPNTSLSRPQTSTTHQHITSHHWDWWRHQVTSAHDWPNTTVFLVFLESIHRNESVLGERVFLCDGVCTFERRNRPQSQIILVAEHSAAAAHAPAASCDTSSSSSSSSSPPIPTHISWL